MRPTRILASTLGLSVLFAGGLLLGRGAGAAPDPAPSGRVAVVDVFELLSKAPQNEQFEQQRRAKMQAINDWKQAKDQELKDLAGKVEREPKATRKPLEEEWARKNAMGEFDEKWKMAEASQWYADNLEQLFAEVRAAIKQVAQERGISLVIAKGDDKASLKQPDNFGIFVATRPVLYADSALDITNDVKARMAASKPPTPPATPPAAPPSPSAVPVPPPAMK